MMAKPGTIKDVLIPPPAPRDFSQKATGAQLVRLTQVSLINSLVERQHRAVLIDIGALVMPGDVQDLGITANSTYVQAELQSVIDKLDVLAANQRAILSLLTDLVTSPATKIVEVDIFGGSGGAG
jgi:hypothetical protein